MYNNSRIIRIFVFVLIYLIFPLCSALYLFWYDTDIPFSYQATEDGKVVARLKLNEYLKPDIKNSLRRFFQSPFGLTSYEICIKNSTRISQGDKGTFLDSRVVIEDDNGEELSVSPIFVGGGMDNCIYTDLKVIVLSETNFRIPGDLIKIGEIVKVDNNVYPQKASPVFPDKIVSSLLFYLSWWALVHLLKDIFYNVFWKKILRL